MPIVLGILFQSGCIFGIIKVSKHLVVALQKSVVVVCSSATTAQI